MTREEQPSSLSRPPPQFVDAHHHVWDLDTNPHYPWLLDPVAPSHMGDYGPLQRSYLVEDYEADLGSVRLQASVHVEANWRRDDPFGETEWLAGVADRCGIPSAIVAFVDLAAADAEEMLEAHARYARVRGIRRMSARPGQPISAMRAGDTILSDPRFRQNLRRLAGFDLSFDLQATPALFDDAADAATACPDVRFALTHVGLPLDRSPEALRYWRDGLRRLADRPNVFIKISGLAMIDPDWTPSSIGETVTVVVDIFGPNRCMIGTNFPVDKLRAEPHALLRAYLDALERYDADERRQVVSGCATQFYRLSPGTSAAEGAGSGARNGSVINDRRHI